MSISTPAGDQRRPSAVSTGKKPAAGAKPTSGSKPAPGGKGAGDKTGSSSKTATGGKPGGAGPGGKSGGGPRKPIKPVKVTQGRAWGPIALFAAVGALAVGIIGYGGYAAYIGSQPWDERAAGIDGIVNFRKSDPASMGQGDHKPGPLTYPVKPPVAGPHNNTWQNCMGDVYDAPIANEHAVHSLEHGAVWITYRSDLPKDQVDALAKKVRGNEFMLMSPVDDLDAPISLQAWGYQLKVKKAGDDRIDDFIKALRQNATMEPQASCAGGITATGTTPRDMTGMQ